MVFSNLQKEYKMTDEFNLNNEISELSKSEIQAYKNFREVYSFQHPHPQKEYPNLKWDFWAIVFISICSIALAAFRTSDAFYKASGSYWEAGVSVVAIEGVIVLFSLLKARRNQKTNEGISDYGLYTAFAISVLAGLLQSSNILSGENAFVSFLEWVLVLVMGVGATVIAWLAGDILGVRLVILDEWREKANERFTNALRTWTANCIKQFKNSSELQAISEQKNERYRTNSPKKEQKRTSPNEQGVRQRIGSFVANVKANEQRTPGPTEISRELGVSKSYASETLQMILNDEPL
jgi:hypothetical protein